MHLAWDQYQIYYEDALAKNDRCDWHGALDSWNEALRFRETIHARWNRGQALLSLGRYEEGFRDYAVRFRLWPDMINDGCGDFRVRLPRWTGEDIHGKRLVLLGEQGFGDVVMMSRYVPVLKAMGINVVMAVPKPLHRLLSQLAPVSGDGDVCCPFFDLMSILQETPETVPGKPYLSYDRTLRQDWLMKLPVDRDGPRVGIAWKANTPNHPRTFQRNIDLREFLPLLNMPDANVYALQPDEPDLARRLGVITPAYNDFADVAAVASLMDLVVGIDSAAINTVGAIGHPRAHVLLPYLSSWRWLGNNVWYPHINRAQQETPGDWASAFAKIKR